MRTAILEASPTSIRLAGALIRAGRLVGFPTETVYGLGASALDASAMADVYAVKGRAADNPLIVHVLNALDAGSVARMGPVAEALADRFWPGPLTLVLPRLDGAGTIAVRCPQHPVARALIEEARRPLAAPSANRSGRPSPTEADHVRSELGGRIPLILDGGPSGVGVESTVVDATELGLQILRPGGVSEEMLREAGFGVKEARLGRGEAPRSPGQKYRHYAPSVPVFTVAGGEEALKTVRAWAVETLRRGMRPGMIAVGDEAGGPWPAFLFADAKAMAGGLFKAMRELEAEVDVILALAPSNEGIGRAVVNRLEKASGGRFYPPGHALPEFGERRDEV